MQEDSFISNIKLSPDDFSISACFSENDLFKFIQSLSLLPKSEIYKKFTFNPAFHLMYQDAVEESLTTLLERLQPNTMMKENQPLLVTAAPSGSGKVNIIMFDSIHVQILFPFPSLTMYIYIYFSITSYFLSFIILAGAADNVFESTVQTFCMQVGS